MTDRQRDAVHAVTPVIFIQQHCYHVLHKWRRNREFKRFNEPGPRAPDDPKRTTQKEGKKIIDPALTL